MIQRLAALVETELDRALSPASLPDVPADLRDILRYALLGGGKRVRPVLCLLVADACGAPRPAALPAALAIETLHNYTLVHDDLPCMDDDLLRRGRPTVHARYGYAQAVLAGDALQALAFRLLASSALPAPALRASLAELARAAGPGGVVGGQWVDVTATPPHDASRIAYVHLHKTADLFLAAASLGALAAPGATETLVDAARAFGRHLGLAFQIADDLLDEPERRTKPAAERELSCLDVWTEAQARHELAAHTDAALGALPALPGDTAPLRDLADRLLHRTA